MADARRVGRSGTEWTDPWRRRPRASFARIGEAALLRLLGILALGIGQIVEAQRGVFREKVEELLLASSMRWRELLAPTASIRSRLQRLHYRAIFLIFRPLPEQAVFDNAMARLDESLTEQGIVRRPRRTDHRLYGSKLVHEAVLC